MTGELEQILDECISRLSRGESYKQCVADYPLYNAVLEPLLYAIAARRWNDVGLILSYRIASQSKPEFVQEDLIRYLADHNVITPVNEFPQYEPLFSK